MLLTIYYSHLQHMDLKPNACLSVVSSSAILQMHNIAIFLHTRVTHALIYSLVKRYI